MATLFRRFMLSWIPEIAFDFYGIVQCVFAGALMLQLLYLFVFNLRLLMHKRKNVITEYPPVSLVICARNEEDQLFKHLPSILEQDYPKYEVIVVNDQSADDSRHILHAYSERYPHLKVIHLERSKHRKFGKKVPLTVGIKGTKYDHLLLTDADCYPDSNQWIKKMMELHSDKKKIVIGYSPYEKQKGFLNRMIRFDATAIAINYFAFAKAGRPYMGVGRNLSYKKETFFDVQGFKKHYHIQSGDDDLFMQEAADRKNTVISDDPETFVTSLPKTNWNEWVKQKQRHFTTAPKYRLINKLFLGIFPSTMILMLVSFVILLFDAEWRWIVAGAFGVRTILYWLINGLLFRKYKSKDMIWMYPILELIHFVLIPFIYYSTERTDIHKW